MLPNDARYFVIADPASHRWTEYQRALDAFGKLNYQLVHWQDVIDRDGDVGALIGEGQRSDDSSSGSDPAGLVRIESPGRDFRISRQFIELGARELRVPSQQLPVLEESIGWIVEPRLYHHGFARLLANMKTSLAKFPNLRWLRDPGDLALLFDKTETCNHLATHGISTPAMIRDESAFVDGKSMIQAIADKGWRSTYVKLNTGSSGAGIVVVDRDGGAITTMLRRGARYYNTLKLQALSPSETLSAVEFLMEQGVCVQEGIELAKYHDEHFDVRVVVLDGKVQFTVFRLSTHPITNLHLGGRRGDWDSCRSQIPKRAWLDAMSACEEAASLYRSNSVGIDLVFDRRYHHHYILEINGFGDFVPGWRDAVNGDTIHQRDLCSVYQKMAGGHLT